jgi:antitoxin component of MazEF toxin-antitoxin module
VAVAARLKSTIWPRKPLRAYDMGLRALTKIRCANLNLYSLAIIRALENNLTKICKWGNSPGLRLPKEIASAAGLVSGSLVRVRLLDSRALLVAPLAGPVAVATTDAAVKPLTNAEKW